MPTAKELTIRLEDRPGTLRKGVPRARGPQSEYCRIPVRSLGRKRFGAFRGGRSRHG